MLMLTSEMNISTKLAQAITGTDRAIGLGGTGGLEYREHWEMPALYPGIQDEARDALVIVEAQLEPASYDVVAKWIASLGMLCNQKGEPGDQVDRVHAYASMLNFPAFCFKASSLDQASDKFSWFPSKGELKDFLDGVALPIRQRAERLEKIANARTKLPPKAHQEPLNERIDHAAKVMADLKLKMRNTKK